MTGGAWEKHLENKSETGIDKESKELLTAPWQRLRMKEGIMSFDQKTADIYSTAEMVICERGRSKASPVFPAKLVYTRFDEYVDEISHLGRLWAVFVTRLHSRADGGRCRRQALDIQQEKWTLPWCPDASKQAAGVHPPRMDEWMNEWIPTMSQCTWMKQHLLRTLSKGWPLLLARFRMIGRSSMA